MRNALLVLLGLVAALSVPVPGKATTITINPGSVNSFRDTRGLNDVGIGQGDRNQLGANIIPSAGSTITATQGGFTAGPVACQPLGTSPNFCATAPVFNLSRLGAWTVTFRNGTDVATTTTPTLDGAASPVPFPVSVTLSGSTSTPTFSFSVPGFTPDALRLNIFDKLITLPNGQKEIIHSQALAASTTSFSIPSTLSTGRTLELGHPYVLNFQVIDLRPGVSEATFLATNSNAHILRRSSSFFDFTPRAAGGPPAVFLPTVGPDPTPGDGRGAPYVFSITSVGPTSVTFIDPLVATGYDYAIGAGDPNFASVLLPDVGDGEFEVLFGATSETVLAGEQFFFPGGGVSAFGVRGIETSAGLDPLDVTAFVTGLTFVSPGAFTGTMTPLIVEVTGPVPGIPAPGSVALLGVGCLAGWWCVARARRRRALG